jgi:hypothetical protein
MKPELEAQILARWPGWFYRATADDGAPVPFAFEHGDGWYDLLVRTFECMEPHVAARDLELVAHHTRYTIYTVTQKFGGLWIVSMPTSPQIVNRLLLARDLSLEICELCGAPAKLRTEYCQTLCAICWIGRESRG